MLAISSRVIGFFRQMMLTLMWQHATSAFVLSCKCLTWEKRWQARAEHFSCLAIVSIGGGAAFIGEFASTVEVDVSLLVNLVRVEVWQGNRLCCSCWNGLACGVAF